MTNRDTMLRAEGFLIGVAAISAVVLLVGLFGGRAPAPMVVLTQVVAMFALIAIRAAQSRSTQVSHG